MRLSACILSPVCAVKSTLLQAIQQEPQLHVSRKIAHTIAEVALIVSSTDAALAADGAGSARSGDLWPELLDCVARLAANASDPRQRETAMDLLSRLAEYAPTMLLPHLEHLRGMFLNGLQDQAVDVKVRLEQLLLLL